MAKVINSLRLKINIFKSRTISIFNLLLTLSILSLVTSCSNDIEVFTDYKEQAIVYGMLDISQDVQYLKVGRTFLNPNTSAQVIAQNKDSLYFEDAEVKIIEEQTGREIIFNLIDSIPKDSGFFQNMSNVLYASNEPLDERYSYRLVVRNNKTGYEAQGSTTIVRDPQVLAPVSQSIKNFSVDPRLSFQLRFANGNYAASQDGYFEFWVAEFPENDTANSVIKKLKWRFVSELRNEGGPRFTSTLRPPVVIPGKAFYNFFLGNFENGVLNNNPVYQRKIIRADFVLYSASQDLADFIEASKPSIGIVQKQSDYTNIENGLGIFTSRNTYRVSKLFVSKDIIDNFNSHAYPEYNVLRMIEK